MRRMLLAALLAVSVPACGCGGGEAGFGERCDSDGDCADGLCVGGVDGDAPRCTRSCGSQLQCPRGWSCSGVTEKDVLVCQKGAATPFGD